MANAAAKKAAKAGQAVSSKVSGIIAAAIIFFLFYRGYWRYQSLSWTHIAGFLFHLVCYVISYYGMIENAKNNATTEIYFDLFCVTVASQVLASVTEYGWYLLIVIPLYGGYLLYGFWGSNPLSKLMGAGAEPEVAPEDAKGSNKPEKTKVKYARGK